MMSKCSTDLAVMASLLEVQPLEAGLCAGLFLRLGFPGLQARQHLQLLASSFWQGAHWGLKAHWGPGADLKSG